MLDKDYRTRIDLNGVITDDWVTQEGSDPLFTEQDIIDEQMKVFAGHVLVIDDSITFRNLISRKLDQANCTYRLAESAEQGIRSVRESLLPGGIAFGCILVDYGLGRKNGLEATSEIRSVGYTGKIIGISAIERQSGDEAPLDKETLKASFLKVGADAFWAKPIRSIDIVKLFESKSTGSRGQESKDEAGGDGGLSADDVSHAIAIVDTPTESSKSTAGVGLAAGGQPDSSSAATVPGTPSRDDSSPPSSQVSSSPSNASDAGESSH